MVLVSERAPERDLRVRHGDDGGLDYPVGTWLNEIVGGWKYHAIVDKVGPRVPLEFAKVWRVAQARTEKPVKFGTIAADLASTVLTVKTDLYDDDKRELMWDIATVLNGELRELAAAGCKVIQIEEPAIHSAAAWGADEATLDFFVDLFNYTVEGLEAEVWVHTCWGNPGAQHCFDPSISYEPSMEIYLDRINADVWTIESKHNNHELLPKLGAYKGKLSKKIAVGMISHRALQVETADEVAADIRMALEHIDPESSCCRPTAASGGKACRGRSPSTRRRRSRRARTSSARSSAPPRRRCARWTRRSRSTSLLLRRRSTRKRDCDRSGGGAVSAERLVIRNGFVVSMDPEIGEIPAADVLVEDGKIVDIGPALDVSDAEEIDATHMIVMPGFVDTHRHVWQTPVRGVLPCCTLDHYFAVMLGSVGGHYRPEDVYIGNYAGSLEALNGGVTTLLDWSHISNTPEHSDAAVEGLATPGSARSTRTASRPAASGGRSASSITRRTSGGSARRTSPPTTSS